MTCNRILFISNLFPNSLQPHRASFSRLQISALSELAEVDVVAPVAWTTPRRREIPSTGRLQGCDVFHPTYWYTPGILRNMYGLFYLGSIRKSVMRLVNSHRYDVIYASWLYPDGWAAARLAREFNIPLVLNVLGTDANRLSSGTAVTEKSLWAIRQSNKTIAVSQALKNHLVGLGANPEKIEVVYNGVDKVTFRPMDRMEMRHQLGAAKNVRLVLFVGNLLESKGLRELAHAFGELAHKKANGDIELIIIGSGSFEQKMRSLLATFGVEKRVRFLGVLPQPEIAKWMNACDVFCLPSYAEGQPNVLIEALACGARIVSTTVGGIPELDLGRGNMRLVEPRSVPLLASALEASLLIGSTPVEGYSVSSWQENALQLRRIFDVLSF